MRNLYKDETITEDTEYWSSSQNKWLSVPKHLVGKAYDPDLFTLMRKV